MQRINAIANKREIKPQAQSLHLSLGLQMCICSFPKWTQWAFNLCNCVLFSRNLPRPRARFWPFGAL